MSTISREHRSSSAIATSIAQPSHRKAASTPGTIALIVGCMFSGKTTALLKHLDRVPVDQRALFKHASDIRYRRDAVVSHNGLSSPAMAITNAVELEKYCGNQVSLVGLDEGHFFDGSVIAAVQKMTSRGVSFAITSLDRDSWGNPFPLMQRLCKSADYVTVMTATCAQCGARADRTQRLSPIVDGDMIGGSESYEPRCARCWCPPPEAPLTYKRPSLRSE